MKYRRLKKEELEELEKEFIRFLATHSIPSQDWEKMKKENRELAESDVHFMELRQAHNIQIVKVDEDPFTMRGIRVIDNPYLNFLDHSSPKTWNKILEKHGGKLQTFQATKTPKKTKNEEKFAFMQNGYLILKDPKLFYTLEDLQKPR